MQRDLFLLGCVLLYAPGFAPTIWPEFGQGALTASQIANVIAISALRKRFVTPKAAGSSPFDPAEIQGTRERS